MPVRIRADFRRTEHPDERNRGDDEEHQQAKILRVGNDRGVSAQASPELRGGR